jgi:hypothetical protein
MGDVFYGGIFAVHPLLGSMSSRAPLSVITGKSKEKSLEIQTTIPYEDKCCHLEF